MPLSRKAAATRQFAAPAGFQRSRSRARLFSPPPALLQVLRFASPADSWRHELAQMRRKRETRLMFRRRQLCTAARQRQDRPQSGLIVLEPELAAVQARDRGREAQAEAGTRRRAAL